MNVLIIGGPVSLTCHLIKKFNKEGHRVSLLTGSYHVNGVYPHVFERYEFPYSSEMLPEIFESAKPDITVFVGAYDSNFAWQDVLHDSVNYISAVMNIMTAYSALGRGRFVYISSDTVFSGNQELLHTEEDEPNAVDSLGQAFIQAENICKRFMTNPELDIITVRLCGYYHFPKDSDDCEDAVSELCIECLKTGKTSIDDKRLMMPLSENDAVFFISEIALAVTHKHSCYHVSSGRSVSISDIVEIILDTAEKAGYTIKGEEEQEDENKRHKGLFQKVTGRVEIGVSAAKDALSGLGDKSRRKIETPESLLDVSRFSGEFGINRLAKLEKDVRDITEHMIENSEDFLGVKKKRPKIVEWMNEKFGWLLHSIVPFIENVLTFIAVYFLTGLISKGDMFGRIDLYLLYVLLFAVTYGQHQATLSALLSTLGFIWAQMHGSSGGEVFFDYDSYVWIAQLFIVGLTVGYVKDRLSAQKDEAMQDHEHMTKQVDDIREINGSNVRVKDAMQTQLINQDDSVGKIYEITSSLDTYSYEEVLFYAADVLRSIMGSEDIALYRVSAGPYARLFTATSEIARSLGNSVKYHDLGEMYESLSTGKPFINRKMDDSLPAMASAIYDNDEIRLIIMIWKLSWDKMTLGQANMLTVTGALIQNAVLRANSYLEMVHKERYIENTKILSKEAFQNTLNIYITAQDKKLTDFVVYRIVPSENESIREAAERASRFVRESDYLGIGEDDGLYLILTNTTTVTARFAIDRLAAAGIETEYVVS